MSELVIENVSYRYKNADRLALNNVTCAFKPGQVTAVVGPSGSGKTTLLSVRSGKSWKAWTAPRRDRCSSMARTLRAWTWTPTGGRMCR